MTQEGIDQPKPVTLVTGASGGIGAAICRRLAHQQRTIVCHANRNLDRAQALAQELSALGCPAHAIAFAVEDHEAVQQAVKSIEDSIGPIDTLVASHGITSDALLPMLKPDAFMQTVEVNLGGVYHCTQAVMRKMLRRRYGRIVLLSSTVGLSGNAGQSAYAASKAAVVGFARSVAREVATRGITVNVVAPGWIETDMTAEIIRQYGEKILEQIPVGRVGTVDEVAHAVAFLASPEASYLTGQTVAPNGGIWMV